MNKKLNKEYGLIRLGRLTKIVVVLLFSILLIPNQSDASNNFTGKTNQSIYMHPLGASTKAAIVVSDASINRFTITIEDRSGETVYHTQTVRNTNNFAKAFDFSKLKDGEYLVKLRSKSGTKKRNFIIKEGEISVFYPEKVKPIFNAVRKRGYLLIPNDYMEEYTTSVISPDGEVLHTSSTSDEKIRKNFNFEYAPSGDYQITVSSKTHQFTFAFNNKDQK